MKLKALALITFTSLLMISCEVTVDESSSPVSTSNISLNNSNKTEIVDYVNESINESSSINMTYIVKTYLEEQSVEVTFYYVSNNSDDIMDFEMTMLTFLKVINKDNSESELMLSQSFYHSASLYFSLLNSTNGIYEKYLVEFANNLTMDELQSMIGTNLFYSAPNEDIFKLIDEELLNKASYEIDNEYSLNFTEVENEAKITYIKVNKDLSKLTILTDEVDAEFNKVVQTITIEPKFNNEKNNITWPSDVSAYELIAFSELVDILNP